MKKVFIILFVIVNVLILSSCRKSDFGKETIMLEDVFSISPYIVLHGNSKTISRIKNNVKTELDKILKELDDKYDTNNENSLISKINKEASSDYVEIDEETYYILSTAIKVSENCGKYNKYDISIYPLLKTWDFVNKYYDGINMYDPPSDSDIKKALELVDYEKIELSEDKIKFEKEGMMIDLGSIVKGYACDKVAKHMNDKYPKMSYVLNVGGNVLTKGNTVRNGAYDDFHVAIQTPFEENIDNQDAHYIGYVKSSKGKLLTVVTSGIYERYIMDKKGKMYHHILDSATGYPLDNNIESISIVIEDKYESILADAYSTALFAYDKATIVSKKSKSFHVGVILIDKDKNIYVSDNIKDRFVLNEEIKEYYTYQEDMFSRK